MTDSFLFIFVVIFLIIKVAFSMFFKAYDRRNKQVFHTKGPVRTTRRDGLLGKLAIYGLTSILDPLLGKEAAKIAIIVLGVLWVILIIAQSG